MRYGLGLDGGGSKCEAVLADETGAVAGRGRGGPVHVYYDPPEVIRASFHEAVAAAVDGLRGAEIVVAGYLPPDDVLAAALSGAASVIGRRPANEVETAFASAQVEWGLVVLAGTGSFVYGRTPDGRHLHFGGSGPVLGDYGSAYAIGLAALRAAFASRWTEARRTSLAEAVPRALGVSTLREVFDLVYVEQINRRRIAHIARTVDEEAERGDRIAIGCLEKAADELADTAVEMVEELGMADLAFPVIPIGSVARGSRLWWQRILARLHAIAPPADPLIPTLPPAAGAALLALRELGVEWTAEVIARMRETSAHVSS
jgi:N-acetylmuramic acid 6-phosphate etherase